MKLNAEPAILAEQAQASFHRAAAVAAEGEDEMAEPCPKGVELEERTMTLEREMKEVRQDIKDIKETLLKRPSWAVAIIITLLSTFAFSALTFSFTVIRMIAGKPIP